MQVLHYRPGEPRTPAVAISQGLGVDIQPRGHRERRPQHDAPTDHDPTHHHRIRFCWVEGTPTDTNSHLPNPARAPCPSRTTVVVCAQCCLRRSAAAAGTSPGEACKVAEAMLCRRVLRAGLDGPRTAAWVHLRPLTTTTIASPGVALRDGACVSRAGRCSTADLLAITGRTTAPARSCLDIRAMYPA